MIDHTQPGSHLVVNQCHKVSQPVACCAGPRNSVQDRLVDGKPKGIVLLVACCSLLLLLWLANGVSFVSEQAARAYPKSRPVSEGKDMRELQLSWLGSAWPSAQKRTVSTSSFSNAFAFALGRPNQTKARQTGARAVRPLG